jgi:hypothetical protein
MLFPTASHKLIVKVSNIICPENSCARNCISLKIFDYTLNIFLNFFDTVKNKSQSLICANLWFDLSERLRHKLSLRLKIWDKSFLK